MYDAEPIDINELISNKNDDRKEESLREGNWGTIEKKEKEKRLNLYHYVVHTLAIFIILSYIFLIVWNYNIPKEFSTIVSIVIGFYFAKSLLNN
ncbi:MAG: hypothetical protein WC438_03420 [Candidatus Pacearchaeota archaeon]